MWLCKLNDRGMLRRSFVPPEAIRDLRALTRLRSRLAQDRVRHQNRIEKILEDALLKISSVISGLMGQSGRRYLAALVAGERSPRALAALGDRRLKASTAKLEAALTGRFRDIHALEIGMLLDLIDGLTAKVELLEQQITGLLARIPGVAGACTSCGETGGDHTPGCAGAGTPVLSVIARLDEIPGVGPDVAQVIVAELGMNGHDPVPRPRPRRGLGQADQPHHPVRRHHQDRPHRQGDPYLCGALGHAAMTAGRTNIFLGERYRRIARRRGTKKAIVAIARTITEIACLIISDPGIRFIELGPDYYARFDAGRQTRTKIRELERLNPGMKVTLTPAG